MTKKPTSAVVVANGQFPTHPIPLSALREAKYIVCCDGAANAFISNIGIPDAIVGDCDSISPENKIRFEDRIYPDPDQYTNDLTKAVNFCISRGIKDITIVGATGKREDHTLGNISLLAEYRLKVRVTMITDYGRFTPIHGETTFESKAGQQVSIFCIDSNPITLTGLKYSLENALLTNWWEGTLNESLGQEFTVSTQGRVIVFQAF
jgi:thiamine pyrophosphokinase